MQSFNQYKTQVNSKSVHSAWDYDISSGSATKYRNHAMEVIRFEEYYTKVDIRFTQTRDHS